MYLTNEDVRDILHLLDTLPFDELHLRTESFELSLRRTANGEWTQATQVLASPTIVSPAPEGPGAVARERGVSVPEDGSSTAAAGGGVAGPADGGVPAAEDRRPERCEYSDREYSASPTEGSAEEASAAEGRRSPGGEDSDREYSVSEEFPVGGSSASPASAVRRETLVEVRAPLPGTFYRAPRPGAPPFVEVGSEVAEDTVVGIVETMKLMNSVIAGSRGTVAEICRANAEFTPQDAVLMRIDPVTR